MPDYWSVPIDNSLYNGAGQSDRERSGFFVPIGNLPNAYW